MEPKQPIGYQHSYETVSEAVNDLVAKGYDTDFLIQEDGEYLFCRDNAMSLSPEEFQIDSIYRFEGNTDPADESIIYAISSKEKNIKGLVINSFGADFGYRSSKLVEYLQRHH